MRMSTGEKRIIIQTGVIDWSVGEKIRYCYKIGYWRIHMTPRWSMWSSLGTLLRCCVVNFFLSMWNKLGSSEMREPQLRNNWCKKSQAKSTVVSVISGQVVLGCIIKAIWASDGACFGSCLQSSSMRSCPDFPCVCWHENFPPQVVSSHGVYPSSEKQTKTNTNTEG